jgi:carbamoyltransferase
MTSKVLLGISCGFHDSAAALVGTDGSVIYASSEERSSRVKGDSAWPQMSIQNALAIANASNNQVVGVCCHENPQKSSLWQVFNKLNPLSDHKPQLSSIKKNLERYKVYTFNLEGLLRRLGLSRQSLFFTDHHVSHAMAARAFSSETSGQVYIFDAFGQGSSGFAGYFDNSRPNNITILKKFKISQSVGLFYSSITALCGFKVLTGEYKLMGLAPYGQPSYYDRICKVFGNPNISKFTTQAIDPFSEHIASDRLQQFLGIQNRIPESPITKQYMDLAASAQFYLEKLIIDIMCQSISSLPKGIEKNIFIGGGVALNCKLTSEIQKKFSDHRVFICPAAGDAGSAIGCCYAKLLDDKSNIQHLQETTTAYLGNNVSQNDTDDYLELLGFRKKAVDESSLLFLSGLLASGKVGAVFKGKSEFGPRALGNRSILADPSKENALSKINKYVKSREDFRPLAPITTEALATSVFYIKAEKMHLLRYMLSLVDVPKSIQDLISSAVHVDGTARLQVINEDDNKFIYELITCFHDLTGVPALINTSFNQRGEPIVDNIEDALTCFVSANLDFLVAGNSILLREEQDESVLMSYQRYESLPLD